jgi:hypothetical protein
VDEGGNAGDADEHEREPLERTGGRQQETRNRGDRKGEEGSGEDNPTPTDPTIRRLHCA